MTNALKSLTSQKTISEDSFKPGDLIVDLQADNPGEDIGIMIPFERIPKELAERFFQGIGDLHQQLEEKIKNKVWAYWIKDKDILWVVRDNVCLLKEWKNTHEGHHT